MRISDWSSDVCSSDLEYELPILKRYCPWLNSDRHRLIHLAVRNTGLFVKPENPKGIDSVADLINPDVRFVNRQIGSSTRFLVALMLSKLNIDTARVQGDRKSTRLNSSH